MCQFYCIFQYPDFIFIDLFPIVCSFILLVDFHSYLYHFLSCTLCLINFFFQQGRILHNYLSCFLLEENKTINFLLSTPFSASDKFWYVLFSFSFDLEYFIISHMISLICDSLGSVQFNFQKFGDFPDIFAFSLFNFVISRLAFLWASWYPMHNFFRAHIHIPYSFSPHLTSTPRAST